MFVLFLQFLFLNAYKVSAAALNMHSWLVGCQFCFFLQDAVAENISI